MKLCKKCSNPITHFDKRTLYCEKHRKIRNSGVFRVCELCTKEFKTLKTNIEQGWGRFCSKNCQNQAQSLGLIKSHSNGCYGYREDLKKTLLEFAITSIGNGNMSLNLSKQI